MLRLRFRDPPKWPSKPWSTLKPLLLFRLANSSSTETHTHIGAKILDVVAIPEPRKPIEQAIEVKADVHETVTPQALVQENLGIYPERETEAIPFARDVLVDEEVCAVDVLLL